MFNQLTRWFMNLRFGSKLLIGFGIMVVISIVIGAAALISITLITNSTNDANTAASQSTLAESIRADMEAARDDEAGYFLNYKTLGLDTAYTRYAAVDQEQVNQVVERLVELQQKQDPNSAGDRPVIRLVALAQDQTKAYQDAFNAAVTATQELGVDRSGLIGQVRTDAETLLAAPELADPASQVILLQLRRNEKDFMLFGTQDKLDNLYAFETQLENQINALAIPVGRKNVLLALAQTYLTDFNTVVQKIREVASDQNNLRLISSNIDQLLAEVSNQEQTNTNNAMASLNSVASLSRVVNIVALVLAILFGLGLALVLRRLLTRQVKEIDVVFSDVRVGEFSSRAKVFGKDELGRMADGLNAMLEQMTGLLTSQAAEALERVQTLAVLGWAWETDAEGRYTYCSENVTGVLGYTADEMIGKMLFDFMLPEEAARIEPMFAEMASKKHPITDLENWNRHQDGSMVCFQTVGVPILDTDGNLTGYRGAGKDISEQKRIVLDVENAAAQVTDASSSMTEVMQLMIDQASNSAQVAEQAAARTQEGDRMVSETIAAMNRIRDNTQETAQRIKRLGEVSQEIGEAVRLIEEVADRTTVLALNASIQAAVAGEAGRGFAVVAEEVQRLAERATGATRKIEGLIKSIQAETNQAVIGIEEATREVVDGSQLAQKAGERMAELNQLVAQLSDLVQQVSETTAKQTGTSMTSLVQLSKGLQESVAAFGVAKQAGGDGHELLGHPASSRN